MNLHKHVWTEALEMNDFRENAQDNVNRMKHLVELSEGYEKRIKEETELTKDQLKTRYVGKVDPKKRTFCLRFCCLYVLTLTMDNRYRRREPGID